MIRKLVNAVAAFAATAVVCPLIAVAAPFAAAVWAWNETED
jgi:hypothetical protein